MGKSKLFYSFCLIFLFGITTYTVTIVSNSENNSAYSQRVLQTYENDKYGIKIQYPANWDTFEYKDFVDETGELVVRLHPAQQENPSVSLLVHFLSPENANLKSFTEQNLKAIQTPIVEGSDEKIKILSQNSSARLGGQPAYQVVYESTSTDLFGNPQTFKNMKIWTVLETEAYEFSFGISSSSLSEGSDIYQQYNEYIKTAEKIINSFEFTR
ncbi:MAG: serine/threonine protein kinase [Nitrososphaeraceae archaeon]|nr:serine/threonine protein kinase [Nitrososphaeraceae archaeon]